jgi:hypothetical protein
MSYFPVGGGIPISSATRESSTSVTSITGSTYKPANICPDGEVWSDYYQTCHPKDIKAGPATACDPSEDEVWDPSTQSCFKPHETPPRWLPGDPDYSWQSTRDKLAASHPFWAQKIGPIDQRMRRADAISVCRHDYKGADRPKEWDKLGKKGWWPTWVPPRETAPGERTMKGYWFCQHQKGCCRGETSPIGVTISSGPSADISAKSTCPPGHPCTQAQAAEFCAKSSQAGILPAGYEPQCTEWLTGTTNKNVYGFLKYLDSLSSGEKEARAQDAARELASRQPGAEPKKAPSWILPAAIGGGALILILALRKK